MNTQKKMAVAGVGLVAAGFGFGVVGAMMIVPAMVSWMASLMEKSADRLLGHAESASKTVGTVAGTLHRSFNEATKAGVAEIRRGAMDRAV